MTVNDELMKVMAEVTRNKITVLGGLFLLAAFVFNANAVQCKSMVGAALKPVDEGSSLSWSVELDFKVGSLEYPGYERDPVNLMGLVALEWDLGENSFLFFEGGVKKWNKSGNSGDGVAFKVPGFGHIPYGTEEWRASQHAGVRELYFESGSDTFLYRTGLQSMVTRDGILLDERVLGMFSDLSLGDSVSMQMGVGTVDRDYSRMGKFCASRHSYRPLSGFYADPISDDLGESNLAFVDFYWTPGVAVGGSNDAFEEFDDGGFEEFESFENGDGNSSNMDDNSEFEFKGAGVSVLSQFGDAFENDSVLAVAYSKFKLGNGLNFVANVGTDVASDSSNYIASLVADYSVIWESAGSVSVNAGYWYISNTDEEGRFYPAYSNLFLGEIAKLDISHGPLLQAGISYSLPSKWPVFFGINYVSKTEGEWARETDYQIGFRPKLNWKVGNVEMGKHLSIVGTYYNIEAVTLNGPFDGWRVETRWAF